MSGNYDPKKYWEQRLASSFSLGKVGHIDFNEAYNAWLYRRKKRCIASCLRDVPLDRKDVLDVGCGTGFFVDWYLKQGASVFGMDITEVSVAKLRQQHKAEFATQDISAPGYRAPRKFDIVNMWDVMYHIVDPAAFERTLDNVSASLKPGGLFLFTDWFGAPSDARVAEHVTARCLDTYRRALTTRGFELVGVYPLYNALNKVHRRRFDDRLGGLYFLFDSLSNSIPKDNLSLGLWRNRQTQDAKTG
jgi:SAM-dependent methyltransferase